jgi:hypothetical protein
MSNRPPLRISTPVRVGVLALGLVFAIRAVQRIVERSDPLPEPTIVVIEDSALNALADEVENAEANAERIAYTIDTRSDGTYLPELLDARNGWNYRWPDRRGEPMRIWVQEPRDNAAYDPSWATVVRESFSVWDGLGLPLTFTFTPDSARAEVHVLWVDRFAERMTGVTQWQNDSNGWIVGASIKIALHLPDGRRVTRDGVQAIARHEVGHLIGLDHTTDTTSIMAPQVYVTELSDADRRTARLVYALPAGKLR